MLRKDSEWWSKGYTREWWKPLPRHEREQFLNRLTPRQAEEFFHDWRVWARDKQLAPDWDWDTWLLLTGRGFGKTRTAVEYILDEINAGRARRIAIVGQGEDDVRIVMVEGVSGFIACSPSWNKPRFYPSAGGGKLVWPNGAQAFIYSIADTESLRGPEFDLGWCDEPMAAARAQRDRALDNLEFCLRLGNHPRLLITTTPKKDPWLRSMERDAKDPEKKMAITRGSTHENAENLAPNFLKKIERKYRGTRIAKQEIDGLILGEEEGALWTEETINAARLPNVDRYEMADACDKVIVSIDPNTKGGETTAAKAKKLAHAAGIIVLGRKLGKRFVLADCTVGGGPAKWARAAVSAAKEFGATEIHAESNQGGDMVKILLLQEMAAQGYTVHVHLSFAKKSKEGRAEPVATMYDRGEVHHVGPAAHFEALETQMMYLHEGEDPTGEDFDRCDALVWGLTRLGLKKRASSSGRAPVGFRTFGEIVDGPSIQESGGGDFRDWSDAEL